MVGILEVLATGWDMVGFSYRWDYSIVQTQAGHPSASSTSKGSAFGGRVVDMYRMYAEYDSFVMLLYGRPVHHLAFASLFGPLFHLFPSSIHCKTV